MDMMGQRSSRGRLEGSAETAHVGRSEGVSACHSFTHQALVVGKFGRLAAVRLETMFTPDSTNRPLSGLASAVMPSVGTTSKSPSSSNRGRTFRRKCHDLQFRALTSWREQKSGDFR